MSLELNCANFSDKKTGELIFPPEGAKTYSSKIDKKNLKKSIAKLTSSELLVISASDNVKRGETSRHEENADQR